MNEFVSFHIQRMLDSNNRLSYYDRVNALLSDCESLRECRKDYWTYEQYAAMLKHTISKLERGAKKVREDIKNSER